MFASLKVVLMNIVIALMKSAKVATLVLLNLKVFWIKVMASLFLSITSPTKIYHVTQVILWMWSYDQSLVTLAFLQERSSGGEETKAGIGLIIYLVWIFEPTWHTNICIGLYSNRNPFPSTKLMKLRQPLGNNKNDGKRVFLYQIFVIFVTIPATLSWN